MSDNVTQRTVLNSGLRVLTGRVSDEATSYYDIVVNIGSGSSDDEIDGQAHFLEHMLFNGVNTSGGFVDHKTLRQQRESQGINFSAYTTQTNTCYMARVPTDLGEEGLNKAIDELSCMVITPALPEERVEHEQRVICNEWGARQGMLAVYLFEQTYMQGYADNLAFSHRIIGEKNTIKQIDRQWLLNFMADHYTQSNTSVTVTGPVEHQRILDVVRDKFSDMSLSIRPDRAQETPLRSVHGITNMDFVSHNYFVLALPWHGAGDIADNLAIRIADFVVSNSLNNTVREENGDVYSLSVGASRNRSEGYLGIETSTEPETVLKVIKDIGFHLKNLATGDISDEVNVAVKFMSNFFKGSQQDTGTLSETLAHIDNTHKELYDPQKMIEELKTITPAQVQGFIRKVYSGPVAFVGIGPEKAFPPQAELESIFALQDAPSGITLRREFDLK